MAIHIDGSFSGYFVNSECVRHAGVNACSMMICRITWQRCSLSAGIIIFFRGQAGLASDHSDCCFNPDFASY